MASEDPPWILAVVEAAVYNDKRKYSVEIRKVEQERYWNPPTWLEVLVD